MILLLSVAACGDDGGGGDPDARRTDAAANSIDANVNTIDAAVNGTDAATPTFDAAIPSPDATPALDAAPLDATPTPDAFPPDAAPPPQLYSVSRDDDQLRTIDPAGGTTLGAVTITIMNDTVDGAVGLARHPISGEVYAILKLGTGGRSLVTLDTTTGIATLIGATGDVISTIAFDSTGVLYGVTGENGANPETLHTVSLVDASVTVVMALGNGADGEALGYNPNDGLFYHLSGPAAVFESIDVSLMAVVGIALSGDAINEGTAMTWDDVAGTIWLVDLDDNLLTLTTAGVTTLIGGMDHQSKGIVWAP